MPPTVEHRVGDAVGGRPAPGGSHAADGATFADALGCCMALADAAVAPGVAGGADPGRAAPGCSDATVPVPADPDDVAPPSDPDAAIPSDPDAAPPSAREVAPPSPREVAPGSDADAVAASTDPEHAVPRAVARDAATAPAADDRDPTAARPPAGGHEARQTARPTVTPSPRHGTDAPQPTSAADAPADGAPADGALDDGTPATSTRATAVAVADGPPAAPVAVAQDRPAQAAPGQRPERGEVRALDEAPAHRGEPQRTPSPASQVDDDAPPSGVRRPAPAGPQRGASRDPSAAATAAPVRGAADATAPAAVEQDAQAPTPTAIRASEHHGDAAPQQRPAPAPPAGPPPATSSGVEGADAVDLPAPVGPPPHPAATEVPEPPQPAPATSRILELVERLRHEPPPRQLVVDLGALGVGRVVVAVRGETVVVGAATPDASIDPQWLRDLGEALDARGWSLDQRGGRQTDGRRQRPLPRWALRLPLPTDGRGADGVLRL